MIRNRQRERAYVVPKNVRNEATKRARTAFGALSKAYSTLLTAEQQQAWNTAAAKVFSRPRLGQSGPLTRQEHFNHVVHVNAGQLTHYPGGYQFYLDKTKAQSERAGL